MSARQSATHAERVARLKACLKEARSSTISAEAIAAFRSRIDARHKAHVRLCQDRAVSNAEREESSSRLCVDIDDIIRFVEAELEDLAPPAVEAVAPIQAPLEPLAILASVPDHEDLGPSLREDVRVVLRVRSLGKQVENAASQLSPHPLPSSVPSSRWLLKSVGGTASPVMPPPQFICLAPLRRPPREPPPCSF